MAKKKNKGKAKAENDDNGASQPAAPSAEGSTSTSTSTSTSKATKSKSKAAQQPPTSPQLIICRNKHWRYISSFHGPWLQLPPEILETLANANYSTPRPRPIDPAVFYDLAKIRRLVDEATNDAVKAATGITSSSVNIHGGSPAAALGLGFQGGGMKLSPERKYRLRVEATQKLSRAYHLDEIACSVATMQSASTLEDVASLVLQRNPNNPDAKYVHFFHEKIPSRQLAESTSLQPLDEVIAAQPTEGEPLRTRATVRVFKEDYEGAAKDLTDALHVYRMYKAHKAPETSQEVEVYERSDRRQEVVLTEDEQPSSLEIQLLFQRAGVYLTIATMHVTAALHLTTEEIAKEGKGKAAAAHTNGDAAKPEKMEAKTAETEAETEPSAPIADAPPPELTRAEKESDKKVLEARKTVKTNAKKALRDYMSYLGHFDYSSNLPIDIAEEFNRKVNAGKHSRRRPHSHNRDDSPSTEKPHTVYTLNQLFAAIPLADLPPYPSTEIAVASSKQPVWKEPTTTIEMVTYGPLLTDALHALLLCHTLVQTSTKELRRHAYMVARLARLADGYPIFQASRSPARADWIEVLRRQGENWLQLSARWEDLCAPAPLPHFGPSSGSGASSQHGLLGPNDTYSPTKAAAAKALPPPQFDGTGSSTQSTKKVDAEMAKKLERLRLHDQAVEDTMVDERVHDTASFRASMNARVRRAEADLKAAKEKEKAAQAEVERKAAKDTKQQWQAAALATFGEPEEIAAFEKKTGVAVPVPQEGGSSKPAATNGTAAAPAQAPTSTAVVKSNGAPSPSSAPAPEADKPKKKPPTTAPAPIPQSAKRWAIDDGREYPILTERAAAVARWVSEAPAGAGATSPGKRKKKGVKKSAASGLAATAHASGSGAVNGTAAADAAASAPSGVNGTGQ